MIGKTNLKSVQEAKDKFRLNAGTKSWGAGSFAKGKKIMQPDVVNDVITVSTSVAASSSGVDPTSYLQQIAQLEAQIDSLNAQIDSLEAEAVVDEAEVASLQAQVWSLQSQVASLTAGTASLQSQLDKAFRSVIINVFSTTGGGIYVPPAYDNLTVNYTSIVKLPPTIINTFATTGGGSP